MDRIGKGRKLAGAGLLLGAATFAAAMVLHDPAVSTDNAYVRADITSVAAKASGYVVEVAVGDNQVVEAGAILFRLDDRDYRARLDQAEANVALALAQVAGREEEVALQHKLVAQAEARLQAARAERALAIKTSERQRALILSQTISEAVLDAGELGLVRGEVGVIAAEADLAAQVQRIALIETQRAAAQAVLAQAEAVRDLARIDLENTVVRAPRKGTVGNRQVRVGRLVSPGVAMLDIVPDEVWVVANFKETQIGRIVPGDRMEVRIDGLPDHPLSGVVDSFAPGSGSVFAVLPADNATGNFVRVVQRLPVKIRFDEDALPKGIVPGLSARVSAIE